MQLLGRRYVGHANAAYRRGGTLWEGRYRAAPIDSEAYFLACCRDIELNPVRADMVERARDYKCSSYGAHALGRADVLVADHPLYRALGPTAALRQEAYRALFRPALEPGFVDALRAATNGGWALGDQLSLYKENCPPFPCLILGVHSITLTPFFPFFQGNAVQESRYRPRAKWQLPREGSRLP